FAASCTTFLLLIRITFEPQLIGTFVVSPIFRHYYCCFGSCCLIGAESETLRLFWSKMEAVVQLELDLNQRNFSERSWRLLFYWVLIMKERSYSGANQKQFNNADYYKEFIHYYCCIGGCCSTGTEVEAWRFFWGKLENVDLLELNLKHGAFFLMGEIYLACFFCPNLLCYNLDNYYCCFGGNRLTGTESGVWMFLWKCYSTGAESETCKLFSLEGFHLAIMLITMKNPGMFFCFDLLRYSLDIIIIVLEAVVILKISAGYDKESRHCYRCFEGCYSTETESGEWRLFWKKLEDVPILQLNLKHRSSSVMGGSCCSIGAKSGALIMLITIESRVKDLSVFFVLIYHASSKDIVNVVMEAVFQLNLNHRNSSEKLADVVLQKSNLRHESFFLVERIHLVTVLITINNPGSSGINWKIFLIGIASKPRGMGIHLRGIRNCCSAGAGSGAWDDHFWSEQEAVVLLKLGLKDGNSPVMQCRLIKTVFETRMFSQNRLGAVVLLRPNLNMAVLLEQTESCEWFKIERSLRHKICFKVIMLITIEKPGCGSTGSKSELCQLLSFGRISFSNNANYDKESRHYYRCFGGCYSTRAESGEWRLFWRELSTKALLGRIGSCCLIRTLSESREINASYDNESRHYYYCFGGCYSTGFESKALRLFWSNVGDVSLLQLNLKHGSSFVKDSFNNNANFDKKKPRYVFDFFCHATNRDIVMNSFSNNAITIRNLDIIIVVLEAVIQPGTESKALMLFWKKVEAVVQLFPGISKECELELKSYTDYLVKNKIQGFVTLHSYEGFILYPWGYQKKLYTDDRENLYKLGEEMRNAIENISGADYDVGQSADILYRANGYSNDYARSLGIKYVFTIEIGSRKMYNFGFIIPKSYISKLAEEVFAEIL
uniref:Peptidase M14 domain-containing protein n=1 Tax=Strongyloides stercoralis TaxID=6248 RepID=A0AAF5DM18_STRER